MHVYNKYRKYQYNCPRKKETAFCFLFIYVQRCVSQLRKLKQKLYKMQFWPLL